MGLLSKIKTDARDSFNRLASKIGSFSFSPTVEIAPLEKQPVQASKKNNQRIAPLPLAITKWFLTDLSAAIHDAAGGNMQRAAQLMTAAKRDGTVYGVLSTRTDGLIRLPKKFKGLPAAVELLEGTEAKKGLFDLMFPPGELAKLIGDGILLGVGVGKMREVVSSPFPDLTHTFQRLDPEFLTYRVNEDAWYYNNILVTPGEGWILYRPGGLLEPWTHGVWPIVGRAYIAKEHAIYGRLTYASKIANPARVGYTTQGSTERQRTGFLAKLIAWGYDNSFVLPPNYDIKIVESNGKGYEIFGHQIEQGDKEIMIALTGQVVTTMGNSGFSNGSIHQAIKQDLIQASAETLASCINTQGLLFWANLRFGGEAALASSPEVSWDTTPPEDQKLKAEIYKSLGEGIATLNASLEKYQKQIAPEVLESDFNLKLETIELPKPEVLEEEIPLVAEELALETEIAAVELIDKETPNYSQALADQMTELQLEFCEHTKKNRCRICGIERDRGVTIGADGQPEWKIAWRPIQASKSVKASKASYSEINFSPPQGVRKACQRGLELVKDGYGGEGLVEETKRWARKLANGENISPEKARKMNAWFARHGAQGEPNGREEISPKYVAWLLWGGDAGKSWSAKLVKQMESADERN